MITTVWVLLTFIYIPGVTPAEPLRYAGYLSEEPRFDKPLDCMGAVTQRLTTGFAKSYHVQMYCDKRSTLEATHD